VHADNFNYSILGDNSQQRVVFLHGLMAFSANWRKIASRIESEYQCLIYDQRGHGRSFKPEDGYSVDTLAEDLYRISEDLGWSRFHLVGHSMGGRVAMIFAHKYPEKVTTLCIEDVGADVSLNAYKYYENMLNIVPTPFTSKDEMNDFFQNKFLKLFTPSEAPDVLVTFLQANQEEKGDGSYDWRFSKNAIIEIVKQGHVRDRWLEVSSFKMPVLLVRGENSHVLSADEFEKMLKVNPIITGAEIKGAGHWVHYEKYEEFTRLLLDFLRSHDA
jgi:pimeloyl-ACP methyl ester carboxylesterase